MQGHDTHALSHPLFNAFIKWPDCNELQKIHIIYCVNENTR